MNLAFVMQRCIKKQYRRGFVLYIVCALAIGLFILIAGLSKFKSGAVLQLSKTASQEKMVVVAQAAINEALASIKADINNSGTTVGGAVKNFWKSGNRAPSKIWEGRYTKSNLKISSGMADEYFGSDGKVSCDVVLYAKEDINECGVKSYIGFVKLIGKIYIDSQKDTLTITEQHDLKIVDLSFPFLDKYALFVKSYCRNINSSNKKFIIEGVKGNNAYSFIYLGNRNYPKCDEYPNGSSGSDVPLVLLDLDFIKDKALLGGANQGAKGFDLKDQDAKNLSKDNFFITNNFLFKNIAGKVNTDDYVKLYTSVKEIVVTYVGLYEQCLQVYEHSFFAKAVVNDYYSCGEDLEKSGIYKNLLEELFPVWHYYYGYTDYNHVGPGKNNGFGYTHPFDGLSSYFDEMAKKNMAKFVGGSMPEIFGEDRKTPVYVEGPVNVRFFKVGLMDESTVHFEINNSSFDGTDKLPINFPCVSCRWENTKNAQTNSFAGKDIGKLDSMTKRLMSHSIDSLSINNFFFGSAENSKPRTNNVSGGGKGYDIFHYLEPQLRTVSSFYNTADDFIKDRIKTINGEKILDLDGISVIYGTDGNNLDLNGVSKYRGKGMIVSFAGNCVLGNLLPSADSDYLKIWLMQGLFYIDEDLDSSVIKASLISNVQQSDNSSAEESREGGLITHKIKTHIIGNLIIDDLFDIEDKQNFKITHDPGIYSNAYPVRVSIGGPKSIYQMDFSGVE